MSEARSRPEGERGEDTAAEIRARLGADSIGDLLEAGKVAQDEQPRKYEFLTIEQLRREPRPEYIIQGVLKPGDLAIFVGAPASGKTFALIELAVLLAMGPAVWAERFTINRCLKVLYCAGEGHWGLLNRYEGALEHLMAGPEDEVRLRVCKVVPNLFQAPPEDREVFYQVCEEFEPDLIVFDTLAASIEGADENIQKDAGIVVGTIRRLQKVTGAVVVLAHHVTHEGRFRGSTVFQGACDLVVKFTDCEGVFKMDALKVKDGPKFESAYFRLKRSPTNPEWMHIEWIAPSFSGAPKTSDGRAEMLDLVRRFAQGEEHAVTDTDVMAWMQTPPAKSTVRGWLRRAEEEPQTGIHVTRRTAKNGRKNVPHYYFELEEPSD